ncbi:uncharacterized protein LOC122510505 [Leptopilina heterotoma]|nr:uncharacterized protein LOC122505731 isoform X2 [Leptopilina heterotoma]XP_043475929.1 uncharacterized protein LOC122507328 [Leptopilina heterotoma]XP_043481136.1 uncharacterized protein LOC122510505 [Leptopilina heterotoma]
MSEDAADGINSQRMEIDNGFDLSNNGELSENENSINVSQGDKESQDNFTFEENDLFHFLNSTLEGQIVLRKYKITGNLDYVRLKDLIIMREIKKDPINYS